MSAQFDQVWRWKPVGDARGGPQGTALQDRGQREDEQRLRGIRGGLPRHHQSLRGPQEAGKDAGATKMSAATIKPFGNLYLGECRLCPFKAGYERGSWGDRWRATYDALRLHLRRKHRTRWEKVPTKSLRRSQDDEKFLDALRISAGQTK
jgi:hypothetical protein